MADRKIINPVTRIEGHARIVLDVGDDGNVRSGQLQVAELRGFEKLVQGMELFKMPLFTSRLCGVCPAAHLLASVAAIENGLGVEVPAEARRLRELLYAGHILHSHALSNFLLTGPDILAGLASPPAARNIFSILGSDPDLARKVLRLRSIGQKTVEIVGGRGVHPVTIIPGGMSCRPRQEEMAAMTSWGREALGLLDHLGERIRKGLEILDPLRNPSRIEHSSLALSNNGEHSWLGGRWVVTAPDGRRRAVFDHSEYADYLVEHVMPGSYMKSVRLRGEPETSFIVGPLARLNVNERIPTPAADQALKAFREGSPRLSVLDYIEARHIEMVYASESIAALASEPAGNGKISMDPAPAEGRFVAAIEAPRGLLVHDYATDAGGRVLSANLIVATQNNYDSINKAVSAMASHLLPENDDNLLTNGVEFVLRCFDPCLACATHAIGRMPMEIIVRHDGAVVRTIVRGAGNDQDHN